MLATDQDIINALAPLESGLNDNFEYLLENRPLLAHYTSIDVLEKILKRNEVWLSNPLFMNDLQEMRFGLSIATGLFSNSNELRDACGTDARAELLRTAYWQCFSKFDQEHSLDVYVFCLSEHDPSDMDGRLSMWRGYGKNGDGAAIVFNTNLVFKRNDSPLIFSKVCYASDQEREFWLKEKISILCNALRVCEIPDDKLHFLAWSFFQIAKWASLTFKHPGFREEGEWRLIYMPDRDKSGLLRERFDYVIGPRGVEPKLKLEIKPMPIEPMPKWTLLDIVDRIILGPSAATPLARNSILRMLSTIGMKELCAKVCSSSIPLRPS